VIKLSETNIFTGGTCRLPRPEIIVTLMLTRGLLAVANLFFLLFFNLQCHCLVFVQKWS